MTWAVTPPSALSAPGGASHPPIHIAFVFNEAPLNWNKWIRQSHRWLSIAFTLAVIINIASFSQEAPPVWVSFLALPPLFLLLFTGLYLFVLPYTAKGRGTRRAD